MAETLTICGGCDLCGLRCTAGVPAAAHEWIDIQDFIESATEEQRAEIAAVEAQSKTLSLGDGIEIEMCRYRDMEAGRCVVYPARPLVCRLLGHVEWMPCPVEKVPRTLPTPRALELMRAYSELDRRTFEQWEDLECQDRD